MKTKIFYLLIAWVLCLNNAKADNLIIPNVIVPQGGTAPLVIGFSFTSSTDKVGFTFKLNMPTGISLVKDEYGDPVFAKDETSIGKLNIQCPGEGNFAGQPSNANATIKGTEGTLLTLTLSADNSLAVGSIHIVNVTNCTFQQKVDGVTTDINVDAFSFTVTIGAPADNRTVLDETSAPVPSAATGVDVRVKRTIKANEWSTICLPFAMTEAQVKAAFGNDVELGAFHGWEATSFDNDDNTTAISVSFNSVNAIEANTPYIIKVSNAVSEFTADNVTIAPEDEPCMTVGKMNRGTFGSFTGSYVPVTIDEECLFLNSNKFWYSKGMTQMKGYRAYFYFQDVLAAYDDATSAPILFSFNNEVTGINSIEKPSSNDSYYNLNGQRVMSPRKGLYIKNNKKVVVK